MLKKILWISLPTIVTLSILGCGKSRQESNDITPPAPAASPIPNKEVTYARLQLSNSSIVKDSDLFMMNLLACDRNIDTGLFTLKAEQPNSIGSISIKIKDFQSYPKLYTCKQATDNIYDPVNVNSKFDTCMVQVTTPSADATSINIYNMHRDEAKIKPFTYAGNCSINIVEIYPEVKGTINCTKLLQTQLDGSPRNPIDNQATADVTTQFHCPLKNY